MNILERILATRDQYDIALYAAKLLGESESNSGSNNDAIMRCLKSHSLLPLFSSLPFPDLSSEQQKHCLEEPTLRTDDISPCRHVDEYVGSCSFAEESHSETLLGKRWQKGNLVLLYVHNTLVGSMKMDGERSILGMRTVEDSQGRRPLVIGGLYATTSAIANAARDVRRHQGMWARLDLEKLPVLPLRFLQYDGWRNPKEMCRKLQKVRDRIEHPFLLRRIGRRLVPQLVGY